MTDKEVSLLVISYLMSISAFVMGLIAVLT